MTNILFLNRSLLLALQTIYCLGILECNLWHSEQIYINKVIVAYELSKMDQSANVQFL